MYKKTSAYCMLVLPFFCVEGKMKPVKKALFVVQKHDATTLHFDFRLEIDGVLVSWAIPKGPSTNPAHKRLAIRTEDHALSYAHFEGVLPEDSYGAGTVMVWDIGHFKPVPHETKKTPSLKTQLKQGHIKIFVEGSVLHGEYSLIQTKGDRWLLIKSNDEFADKKTNLIKTRTRSALSNKTMRQIKAAC